MKLQLGKGLKKGRRKSNRKTLGAGPRKLNDRIEASMAKIAELEKTA
jgi:hypothetical protein